MLSRVLDAVTQAAPRIVVGPPELGRMLPPDVTLTREDPPGGGPVAAIAAGLCLMPGVDPASQLAVLASDLPFLSAGAISALRVAQAQAAPPPMDAAVLVDETGRPQWLAGVWRLGSLADRLAVLGDPAGRSMRDLTSGLRVVPVRLTGRPGPPPWFDCDTEDDLRQAEEWAHGDIG